MAHVIERAASGRAKCRGCGGKIAAGEHRFGERLPNPFADDGGEMIHWYHIACAAFRRPEALLETLGTTPETIEDRDRLAHEARLGAAYHRLPRMSAAGRATSGRASCRSCRALIEKGVWRIALVFYEEGRFVPAGFVHMRCAATYFETSDVLGRLRHFSPALSEADLEEVQAELNAQPPGGQSVQ